MRSSTFQGVCNECPSGSLSAMRDDLVHWLRQSPDIIELCLAELTSWNRAAAAEVRREVAGGARLRLVLDEPAEGLQRLRLRLLRSDGGNRWVFCWYAGSVPRGPEAIPPRGKSSRLLVG